MNKTSRRRDCNAIQQWNKNSLLLILAVLDKLDNLDNNKICQYVSSLQNDDGSFSGDAFDGLDFGKQFGVLLFQIRFADPFVVGSVFAIFRGHPAFCTINYLDGLECHDGDFEGTVVCYCCGCENKGSLWHKSKPKANNLCCRMAFGYLVC